MSVREPTTMTEYLDRLDTAIDVCDGLRALAEGDAEMVPAAARAGEAGAAYDQYMRSLFLYLEAKFEYFWFENQDVAAMIRKARPDVEEFSAADLLEFARVLLYITQGCRYEPDPEHPGDLACTDPTPVTGAPDETPPTLTVARASLSHAPCERAVLEDFLTTICVQRAVGYFFTTARLSNDALAYVQQLSHGPFAGRMYVIDAAKLLHVIEIAHDICDEIDELGLIAAIEDLDPDEEEFAFAESVEVLRGEAQEILIAPPTLDG